MKCPSPACGCDTTQILETRQRRFLMITYRRHYCPDCGRRFTTWQMYDFIGARLLYYTARALRKITKSINWDQFTKE